MEIMNRIIFEKPDLKALTAKYSVVDLHFHSCHSDGKNTVKEIAKRTRELGIGIAITDHNAIKGAVAIDKYKDILSIPGIEVTSKEGTHVLIYFYEINDLKWFYKVHVKPYLGSKLMSSLSLELNDVLHRARLFKTVVIFPHPYSSAYIGICNSFFSFGQQKQLLERADGVEAINSENLNKWNLKCALLGFNLGKAITGGSDGHATYQIGKVVSVARCEKTRGDFLDAIKAGNNKVIGKEIHLLSKVKSNGSKLKKNLNNYPDLVEKNVKYSYSLINSKTRVLRDNIRRSIGKRIRQAEKLLKTG